ncbi:MAG: pantetheine-phosphate adenylyltransferase [Chloroflexota bacterium]|nr:MAG: pantetheine-phosphate adenylyltransferase [Chloroflexota bacterium]
MTVAVLPASFDPITCGHVDIIVRASRLFERVIVAVYAHPRKAVMFSLEERVAMVREAVDHLDGVGVCSFQGLLVDFCRGAGADVLVRGLRAVSDFEYEYQQAAMNRKMLPGLEVISMFPNPDYSFVSSTIIKEIAENGGDVAGMVPGPVVTRLAERFAERHMSRISRR